jgi:antitoxin component YwqK of YwqJK toxin-antitoxin module
MNGSYKEYFENKNIREEGQYYNGLEHGAFKFFDVNGKLLSQRTYYYGTLINATK